MFSLDEVTESTLEYFKGDEFKRWSKENEQI